MIEEVDVNGDGRIDFNGKNSSGTLVKLKAVSSEFVRAVADPSDGPFFYGDREP